MKSKNNFFSSHSGLITFLLLVVFFGFALRERWHDAWVGITARTNSIYEGDTQNILFKANLGVYDPKQYFASSTSMAFEHVFVQWNEFDAAGLEGDVREIIKRNRWPLVTVEPFVRDGYGPDTLLSDISRGRYDDITKNLCTVFAKVHHPVLVRWGHEMDIASGRYPWATNDSQSFISAYQHFVTACRAEYKEIYFVWSPAGDSNLAHYWPGGEYADYVGLSVYEYPLWDKVQYGHARSFQEIFDEKYSFVSSFGKPVMIAEFGVVGDSAYQKEWLYSAYRIFDTYPLLKSVIYFNSEDHAGVWGDGVPTPDWRIDPKVFAK